MRGDSFFGNPGWKSLIEGRFAYAVEISRFPPAAPKTGAYADANRKSDAGFCVKGFRYFSETNASAPTVQLLRIRAVLDVIVYRKWNFRATDVSRSFSRPGPLKRDAYARLPRGVEKPSTDRNLLKPLYGLSTACKYWYKTIRGFLANECVCVCVGGSYSLDKSVFFWTQHVFGYEYGGGFRDPNSPNLDNGILKVIENFETIEQRKVLGVIAIHVEDLLISGVDVFYRVRPQ